MAYLDFVANRGGSDCHDDVANRGNSNCNDDFANPGGSNCHDDIANRGNSNYHDDFANRGGSDCHDDVANRGNSNYHDDFANPGGTNCHDVASRGCVIGIFFSIVGAIHHHLTHAHRISATYLARVEGPDGSHNLILDDCFNGTHRSCRGGDGIPHRDVGRAHHYISIADNVARVDGSDGCHRLAHAGIALRLR